MKTNSLNTKRMLPLIALHSLTPVGVSTWPNRYDTLVGGLERGNNRWGMQAFMLAVQGNILAPLALLIFQYYDFGYQDYFAGLLGVLFLGVLVANIAVLPVRIILNIFLLNLAIHAGLIAWHLLR